MVFTFFGWYLEDGRIHLGYVVSDQGVKLQLIYNQLGGTWTP